MLHRLVTELLRKIFLPVIILILVATLYSIYYVKLELIFPKETVEYFDKWIFTLFATLAAFLLQKLISTSIDWYGLNIAEKTKTSLDEEFLPLLKKLAIFLIWIIVLLMVLSRFGIDTKGLIAALGVGSLAIALAAQDTISNIISGFLIIVDRPFRINDKIKLPSGEDVKVLQIGLRRSKFLSADGAIIIVPNLELSKSKIVNYTYGEEKHKSQS